MKAKTRFAIASCAVILMTGMAAETALAAGPFPTTGATQSEPDRVGVIENINSANNSITVSDRVYILQSNTVFHGNRASRSGLHTGMTVGINSVPGSDGVPIATEIWIQ